MTISRQVVLKEARDILLFALVCVVQTYFVCPGCDSFNNYFYVWMFTICMWIVLWKGNSIVGNQISCRISWLEFPLKRLLVGFLGTIAYTFTAIFLLMSFFEYFVGFNFGKSYLYTIYLAVGLTITLSLILHSRSFLMHWRQAALDAAKYERESIAARYESLKNQVNPHFLFNSFNALTNLVYEDQDKAVKFIKQLSDVYRYVLDTRDKEMVSLEEEMKFLRSYTYLQQIRFENKLIIENMIETQAINVAPLALQMLIENAIKHNVVSEADPLHVKLYREGDYLIVENNLQRKTTLGESSVGVGLENICKRYEFLSDKKVEISTGPDKFMVKLPVLI
jgi:LytS/YehU family sensor histidine kinase